MFGITTRNARRIAELEERVQLLVEQRDNARSLAATHQGNLARMAQLRSVDHDELTRLRQEAERTERYRTAWMSASRRALPVSWGVPLWRTEDRLLRSRLTRVLRACARYRADLAVQHRVVDRLSDQLMGAMGYTDAALMRLSVDLAATDTTPGD